MKKLYQYLKITALLLAALTFTIPATGQMTGMEKKKLQTYATQLYKQSLQKQRALELEAIRRGFPLQLKGVGKQILTLHNIVNGHPIYIAPDNINSVRSVSADRVKPGGDLALNLTGFGIRMGIWEAFENNNGTSAAAVRVIHQELGGRAIQNDAGPFSDHATHVAGTMIAQGIDPDAEGFSTMGDLLCFDVNNDLAEMAAAAAAGDPVLISNHSYGAIAGWYFNDAGNWVFYGGNASEDWKFGAYDQSAQSWDATAYSAPFLLIIKSAGNDRNDAAFADLTNHLHVGDDTNTFNDFHETDGGADGFDCIPTNGTAKNILTVGAVADLRSGYSGPGSVSMSGFSGWGPTDDGRIKPDIVANGVRVYSPIADDDQAYSAFSGTSMSAPAVSGAAGLLLEHWQNTLGALPRAATTKGLLIHSADEAGADIGPDYSFGWGMLNVADAAEFITIENYEGCELHYEQTIAVGQTIDFNLESSGQYPLKVTLVWHDPAPAGGINTGTVNPANVRYLVNDLDLRVIGGGHTFFPWVPDPANPGAAATRGNNDRDNVEQVLILHPDAGTYTVRVTAPATLTDGPQTFSIWFSGNDSVIDNLTVSSTTLSNPHTYAVDHSITFGPSVEVAIPAEVEAFAGESIRLQPGFRTQPGAHFRAAIEAGGGCGVFTGRLKTGNYPGTSFSSGILADRSNERIPVIDLQSEPETLPLPMEVNVFPNPAVSEITLRYTLGQAGAVTLRLLNTQGQPVQSFGATRTLPAGSHSEVWPLDKALPAGTYYVQLEMESGVSAVPLVIGRL